MDHHHDQHDHDAHLEEDASHQIDHHHGADEPDQSHSQSWFDTLGKFASHLVSDIAAEAIADHATDLLGEKAHPDGAHHGSFVGDHHDAGFAHQNGEKTCSVVAQKMIMDQFGVVNPATGHLFDEETLANQAIHHGWLTESGGTTIEHMGKSMEINGIHNHHGNTWQELLHDLSQGHRVVAAVNTNDIDHPLWQQLLDVLVPLPGLDQEQYNHVVVLKGIEMDANGHMEVVVNDPGLEHGANHRISPDQLRDSLGKIHYVSTDEAPAVWHENSPLDEHDFGHVNAESTFAEMISKLNDTDRHDFLRNI